MSERRKMKLGEAVGSMDADRPVILVPILGWASRKHIYSRGEDKNYHYEGYTQ